MISQARPSRVNDRSGGRRESPAAVGRIRAASVKSGCARRSRLERHNAQPCANDSEFADAQSGDVIITTSDQSGSRVPERLRRET